MFQFLPKIFKPKFEYGHFGTGYKKPQLARRCTKTGKVYFVLWKAGEQGHAEDYWHEVGLGWDETFVKDDSWQPM